MAENSRPGLRYRMGGPALLFAIALALALTESAEQHFANRATPFATSYLAVLWAVLLPWLLRAVLAPFVGVLARRFPFSSGRFLLPLAAHSAASAVFAFTHLALLAALHQFRWQDPFPYPAALRSLLSSYFVANIVIYWAIAGGYFAFEYHRAFQRRDRAALELKASLAEARLQALRGQLQPHFLFNALNTVGMLIRQGLHEQAIDTLSELGELLRRLLRDAAGNEITLASEIEFVRAYLNIEQIRFADRLDVRIDVQPDVSSACVPALILQPLAENAIRHGLAGTAAGARIDVSARARDGTLQLEVRDNGCGLPAGFSLEQSNGVGLRNTIERLTQLYGEDFSFSLEQGSPGLGVILKLPFRPLSAA